MPQPIRKGPFLTCPRSGRIIGVTSVWWRWLLPVVGFLALIWYLVRVVPKPSRANYPCQRVAAPLASGFLTYITGWVVLWFGFRGLRVNLRRADYLAAAACALVMGVGLMMSLPPDRAGATGGTFVPPDPNSPLGIGKGIHPGRVVWTHAPDAANWDGQSDYWWQDEWNDQAVIDKMISETVRSLTGATTDAAAWDALFRHYNQTHGRGDKGYKTGEKIAVKLNLNNTVTYLTGMSPQEVLDNQLDPSPQVVLALLRQLVNQAGVPQDCITLYDAVRYFPDIIFDKFKGETGEFPDVVCMDKIGGRGRVPAAFTTESIQFSMPMPNPPEDGPCSSDVATCLVEADYVINMALLKGHVLAGVTLTAKNHYGSLYQDAYGKNREHYTYLNTKQPNVPAPLVDLIGCQHIGGKTMLYLIDALYAARHQGFIDEVTPPNLPARFDNPPFNHRWPASLLASQDPVAIDSVGLDFLASETGFIPRSEDYYDLTTTVPDNYLHEAALAHAPPSGTVYRPNGPAFPLTSLGVHEHWNNPQDRLYSRNLGQPEGIELVAVRIAPSRFKADGGWDSADYQLAGQNGMRLVAAAHGGTLYVAGTLPEGDDDHVILVSQSTAVSGPAPAGKSGEVACNVETQPYLIVRGRDKSIEWVHGGVSATCAAADSPTGCFEGTISLAEAFGTLPATVHVALAVYARDTGGALRPALQVPSSTDSDGDVDAAEFLQVPVAAILDSAFAGSFDAVDPARGFVLGLNHSAGGDLLLWPCIPGHRYRVAATTDLALPFTPITGEMVAGPSQFQMSHTPVPPPAGPRYFYRVQHDDP